MTAIRNRVSRTGWDEDLTHEITAILDEAAQRTPARRAQDREELLAAIAAWPHPATMSQA